MHQSLLGLIEFQYLLKLWNQTQADYLANKCIHQLLELQVERIPDKIAIIFEEQQITYQELNRRANQLAHYLQSLQVGPDVLVGICMKRSLLMVIGMLGILKAGGAYVPLDPSYPKERLALMIEDSQLPVLLIEHDQLDLLPYDSARVVCCDTDWETIAKASEDNPDSGVTPDNLAYTIYTSGSTGRPKGVQIIHRAVVNFLISMSQAPGLNEQDVLLAITTISFDIAALELYLPLYMGAIIVLVTRFVAIEPSVLLQTLAQKRVTVMQATPATWRMLLAAGWQGNKHLKILCGGEATHRDMANQLLTKSASVWNMYGPTETTIWSAVHRVEPGETSVPIGKPIANTQIYLVDPDQLLENNLIKLVPVGESGELLIGGVGLARGYLNRPELTDEKFIPNPFSNELGSRLYRTGDLARYLPDGNIEFIGRVDYQVKLRGFRFELGDIETALCQHPSIKEAVVITREENSDKRLVAYIVPTSRSQQIPQLRNFIKEKLPEFMVPTTFVVMEALPLTLNNKIDRRALPAPNQARPDLETLFVAPQTPHEEQLAHMWSQLLGIEQVGVHDSFFELGGNSLLATQMLSQVREKFQLEMPLLALFQAPTVAGLATAIAVAQNSGSKLKLDSIKFTDLQADAILEPTIVPEALFTDEVTEPQQILLTGASGFLGAFLMHELLQQTQAIIYCLVRASNLEQARQKLRSNLKRYLLPDEKLDTQIIPVLGDLSQPLLGLSEQQFRELAVEIDLIYHNGAFVNLIYPYTAMRAVNVLGTKEILKLASLIKVKPVHFISTLDVFQSRRYAQMEVILEKDHIVEPEALSDGYAQSKWVAEKLVMAAHSRGIPACIYRPGTIIGHSKTGASQTDDLVARLIKGLIQLGSAPELDLKMSLTPVDYVSKAIIHLSRQPTLWGKAFHLVSPDALRFCQFVNEIRTLGYSIQWTDYSLWQAQLLNGAAKQENALSPLLFLFAEWGSRNQPSYLETAALMSQAFDCQNTLAGLGDSVVCSTVNAQLLRVYFSYLLK
ncbi:MAG: amino acid adenylation domain-containing protein [Rhizonema sp. PD37]|nr:amino acid adenylation domain-containing protein [Rhizonema sp. PD37]